jgi:hypothetical protein
MNAPVRREVDRISSEVGRYLTGLPAWKTHEPGRQNLGDFGEALACG